MMQQRFYSLDVFRGATVALMILVNTPGSWSHIYPPLEHAAWHGCTPTDLVFPFFLFAVGNAMAFVLPRLQKAGDAAFWRKVVQRSLLIFAIGLLLNWFPFVKWDAGHLVPKPFAQVRLLGVLQRIAICYFFASIIAYYLRGKAAMIAGAVLLLGYWLLCYLGNPADPYSLHGWFGTAIDRAVLGVAHIYKGEGIPFDPEGLISSLAAIVQVLIGYFTGRFILQKGKTHEMVSGLFVMGCVLVFAGFCWDMVFPINKKIWTSSYTIYTSGLALLVLACLVYSIEFKGWQGGWSRFFDVFGKNPLFIFVLSGALPRLLALIRIPLRVNREGIVSYTSPFGWFYEKVCAHSFPDPRMGSLLYALVMIAMYWAIGWVMDKKKIYIKV
jgi:predicted acyltransferase